MSDEVDWRVLADGLQHPEGVAWDPTTGRVYAGGEAGQVYAVTLDGEVEEVARTGGSLLGLAIDRVGRVYACDAGHEEVVRVDPASGVVETYSTGSGNMRFEEPNMCAFDDDGTLYVTSSGNDLVFRVGAGGATDVWSDDVPGYPNGCALTPDGDALIVVQSHPGDLEGGRILWLPITSEGAAGEPEVVAELERTVPDGVAFDAEGRLYVACYRPDRILRIDPDGDVEVLVDDWAAEDLDAPTNIAFCGPELATAVVACVGDTFLAAADLGVFGAPVFRPEL